MKSDMNLNAGWKKLPNGMREEKKKEKFFHIQRILSFIVRARNEKLRNIKNYRKWMIRCIGMKLLKKYYWRGKYFVIHREKERKNFTFFSSSWDEKKNFNSKEKKEKDLKEKG
jgi:hypothetical protein